GPGAGAGAVHAHPRRGHPGPGAAHPRRAPGRRVGRRHHLLGAAGAGRGRRAQRGLRPDRPAQPVVRPGQHGRIRRRPDPHEQPPADGQRRTRPPVGAPLDPRRMNPPATTRLILLRRDPAHPATCLELDPRGRILSRRPLDPAHPAPPGPAARTVVAVPGEAVRTLWLDLPAHNPVQALAAARILLQEHVAGDLDGLHIAIGPSGQGPRLLAVADDAQVHAWRQRAQALGVVPDALVPVQLLADAPADRPLQVLEHDGLWLVRGPQLALAAEPALAQRIIGTRGMRQVEDAAAVEALLAAGAAAAIPGGIDLLQYAHARPRDRAVSSRRRRLALLAALCLLSPLLLQGASALRHALGAHWL